jgi:caa(3)-type oxidase subunit IV
MADTPFSPAVPAAGTHSPGKPDEHAHPSYVRIWLILLGLLAVSVTGPMIGIRAVTLVTAFGIAIVKAFMVCRYFMHMNLERRYITYLVGSMLVLMFLMVGALSPDIMHHQGANWTNTAAEAVVRNGMDHPPVEEHEATEKDRAEHEGGGKDVSGHEAGVKTPDGIQKAPALNPPPGK